MKELIQLARTTLSQKAYLPFSVYSSVKEQYILNVPIVKPLLIFVLDGEKNLGEKSEIVCPSGSFIFLSNSSTIDMRNIPCGHEYFAILIEFDYEDFKQFEGEQLKAQQYLLGETNAILEKSLHQFIEWSLFAPEEIWSMRKQELLQVLSHLGYGVYSMAKKGSKFSHRLHDMISANLTQDLTIDVFCSQLGMSESTLRRRLKAEGSSLQEIKDKTKLGHGLHLIQTTNDPIGIIADKCGYHSQSRFTDRFKQCFGVTPSALRRTRMPD
ncbi:MAG: AraC family transcriptional regulator [Cocleimonas sp.]